jgi:hypothetical protein
MISQGEVPGTNSKHGVGEEILLELVLSKMLTIDLHSASSGLQPMWQPLGPEIDSTSASMCDESMTKSSSTTDFGSVDSALVDTDHQQHLRRALPAWLAPKPNNEIIEGDQQVLSRNALREKGRNALAMIQTHDCGMHTNGTATNLDRLRSIGQDVLVDVSKRSQNPSPSNNHCAQSQYSLLATVAPPSYLQFEPDAQQIWGAASTWERGMPMRTCSDLQAEVVAISHTAAGTPMKIEMTSLMSI